LTFDTKFVFITEIFLVFAIIPVSGAGSRVYDDWRPDYFRIALKLLAMESNGGGVPCRTVENVNPAVFSAKTSRITGIELRSRTIVCSHIIRPRSTRSRL